MAGRVFCKSLNAGESKKSVKVCCCGGFVVGDAGVSGIEVLVCSCCRCWCDSGTGNDPEKVGNAGGGKSGGTELSVFPDELFNSILRWSGNMLFLRVVDI